MTDTAASAPRFLLLPGWLGSDPDHWQSRWVTRHACERVEQADWLWPKRGDWMAHLDEVVLASSRPAVLIAHSLGCHLAAAWAVHSCLTSRVQAALLVAIPDTARDDVAPNLRPWRAIEQRPLPFPSLAVISSNDPYCSSERAAEIARGWGAASFDLGPQGHINSESALGDWPQGWALVERLLR